MLGVDVDRVALRTVHAPYSGRFGRAQRVEYRQAHSGVPILGSRTFFTLLDSGEVPVMGAETF